MDGLSLINRNTSITSKGKIETTLDLTIHILCFLSVLLIGADIWGINIGVNLRLDQLFLTLLTALLIVNNSYRLRRNYSITLFLLLSFVSVIFAFDVLRSFAFYLSIVFNTFCIFYCFYSYISTYGLNKFINICRKTIYIQSILIIIQFLLRVTTGMTISVFRDYGYYFGIPRFCIWFYEPSFFATYFIFWFAFSIYNLLINSNKNYLKDVLLVAVALFLSTSATGYVGAAFSLVLVYLIWISKNITFKKIVVLVLIISIAVAMLIVFHNVFEVFIGRIFNNGLNDASGGRVERWLEAYEVFAEHVLFGVGPGNFGIYLKGDYSYVPSNVTLELMATTGIFATISFYLILVEMIVKVYRINHLNGKGDVGCINSLLFGLIIFTIFLQVNQGYLRLYHWMFFGMIEGACFCFYKERKGTTNV